MERRVLFAIFLCFVVLYVWQGLFVKPQPEPVGGAPEAGFAAPTGATGASRTQPERRTTPSQALARTARPAASAVVGDTTERDIRIETQDVTAVFTNRGARLKSWKLKKYLDRDQQPQELVESGAEPLPFTLRTADEQINATLNSALYAVSGQPIDGSAGSRPTDLRFEYRDSSGVHAIKGFHLEPSSYLVTLRTMVAAGDGTLPAAIVWGPALGDHLRVSNLVQGAQGILFESGRAVRLTAKKIAEMPVHEGNYRYGGVDDNYFMTVALDPGLRKITFKTATFPPPAGSSAETRVLVSYAVEPGQEQDGAPLTFFVGPKELDVLTAIDPEFSTAIHFGRFAVIVVPLLQSLKWVHGYVGNWGWAIVILTFIINLVTAPLRHKQVVSMRKMQEIQPEVKAIQDRYGKLKATDPGKQKMNQEMMALYREKHVNPAAGCVPMLLTFPIMIAMWAVLQVSIELRGAPWFGWIQDLSAPDPYYLLPVLMVVTQFAQQRMTPMAGVDPMQQKMMMFMPLVMGFIFFSLPAGALLYYVAGTIIGIGQQVLTNRIIGPPNVRTVRPSAERRVKGGRGRKTDAVSRDQ